MLPNLVTLWLTSASILCSALWWIRICGDLPLHTNSPPEPLTVGVLTLEPPEVSRVNLTSTSFHMVKFRTDVINRYSIFVLRTDNGRYSVFKNKCFHLFLNWWTVMAYLLGGTCNQVTSSLQCHGRSFACRKLEIIQNIWNLMMNWRLISQAIFPQLYVYR